MVHPEQQIEIFINIIMHEYNNLGNYLFTSHFVTVKLIKLNI